jgi:hypothetical protein
MQVVSLLAEHFKRIQLPAVLYPYCIIPTRSGPGRNIGAILEVVPQVSENDKNYMNDGWIPMI